MYVETLDEIDTIKSMKDIQPEAKKKQLVKLWKQFNLLDSILKHLVDIKEDPAFTFCEDDSGR
jgi:hypothetical protein